MNLNNFSNNLVFLRNKHNLSQTGLADKLGLTRQTISNYENGVREPDLVNLIKISTFFKCSIDELIFNGTSVLVSDLSQLNGIDDFLSDLNSDSELLNSLIDKKIKLQTMYNTIPRKIELLDSIIKIVQEDAKKDSE